MFLASSFLYTYQVDFIDSTGSSDLSAVQVDDESTYVAVETAFNGFEGEVGRKHQQHVKTKNMRHINSHPCITCMSFYLCGIMIIMVCAVLLERTLIPIIV